MLGHCDPVPWMLDRAVPQELSVDHLKAEWKSQQQRVLRRVGPSSDPALDAATFDISVAERDRGVLGGPFEKLEDLPYDDVCLVPRHGVWEQHGGATTPTARATDDRLVGGQNGAVSYASTHRPADGDALCAQQRALQERFPSSGTAGWTSDFAKAYKQVPHTPAYTALIVIAQWSPMEKSVLFWLAYTQLFGGSSAPQNFSRYPAWFCFALAAALAVAVQHCVDDMLSMDRGETVEVGWQCWRRLAAALGWDMPDR